MRVIQERFEGGILAERVIYDYDPDPLVPTAAAVVEPQEARTPLVSMAEWVASKAKQP